MNVDGNETVTISHGLNLSHSLWGSQLGSVANQLELECVRALPRDKLSPSIK
jgi:hypothetical protein